MSIDPHALDLLVIVMAALTACAVVVCVFALLAPQKPLMRRARQMLDPAARRHSRHAANARAASERTSAALLIKRLARRFEGLRAHAGKEVAEQLSRAGWRSKDAVVLFVGARIALPFVMGALAFVVVNVLNLIPVGPDVERLCPIAGVIIGFLLPGQIVGKAIKKREKAVGSSLPNALDLMVICAEAGLSQDFAIQRVAHEMEASDPEIAEELGLVALERRILPERRRALDNLVKRCPISSVKALVQTMLQAEEYGTPLSHSLRILANEMRTERMLKAEGKAAKAPVLMTVPMVLFILPALFIVLIGPGLLRTLDALSGF